MVIKMKVKEFDVNKVYDIHISITRAELEIRKSFPEDTIRFRTQDVRGFNPDHLDGCVKFDR